MFINLVHIGIITISLVVVLGERRREAIAILLSLTIQSKLPALVPALLLLLQTTGE